MPSSTEKCLGGHAVLIVGFDAIKKVYIVRNSWGPNWGQAGYFTLPYAYVLDPNLASDFWVVKNVNDTTTNIVHTTFGDAKSKINSI